MTEYDDWMRAALVEAQRAVGLSSPNPPVGAVVISAGQIVGRGYTQSPGEAHAEVMALREAGRAARGATLVCTLEPCAHTGRTGPCVDAIIEAGITEVVYAVADPTPLATGGHQRLAAAGIAVHDGVLHEQARSGALRAWLHVQRTARPYVIWKVGQSLDGQTAAEDSSSQWITGADARTEVHRLRSEVDAIIVGAGTVRSDDPQLTARGADGVLAQRQPLRVVLSSRGMLPRRAQVLDGSVSTLVAVGPDAAHQPLGDLPPGTDLWRSPGRAGEGIDLGGLLRMLGERGALSVLVEGGATVAGSFAGDGLIDEVRAYIAPKLLVSGMWPALRGYGVKSIDEAIDLEITDVRQVGRDLCVTAVRSVEESQEG